MVTLYQNGKTKFSICLPENRVDDDFLAASFLVEQIKRAGGPELEIKSRTSAKFIVLKHSEDQKVEISVSPNEIVLSGPGESGTIDATIEFLRRILDLDVMDDGETFIRRKKIVRLNEGTVAVTPSFKHRMSTYGWIRSNEKLKKLTRTESAEDVFVTGNNYHNAFEILRYDGTDVKKEWMSGDEKQLCYSSEEMKNVFTKNLLKYLKDPSKADLTKHYLVLGMEDNLSWCGCEKCKKEMPSDTMVSFVNDVESVVNAELEKEGKKAIRFLLFAYYNTLRPPVKTRCNKRVGVFFAPIKASFRHGINADENRSYLKYLEEWARRTETIFVWTYSFYTRRNLLPFSDFDSIGQDYMLLNSLGVKLLYDQTESYSMEQTGFSHLKAYLQFHLAWNSNEDVRLLTKRYFAQAFGVAGKKLGEIYQKTMKLQDDLVKEEKLPPRDASREGRDDYWSEIGQTIDRFECLKKTKIRHSVIDCLKSIVLDYEALIGSPELAPPIKKRILIESVSPRFLLLLIDGKEDNMEAKRLYALIKSCGITHWKEGGTIKDETMFLNMIDEERKKL